MIASLFIGFFIGFVVVYVLIGIYRLLEEII